MVRHSKARRGSEAWHEGYRHRLFLENLEGRLPPGDALGGLFAWAWWGPGLGLLAGSVGAPDLLAASVARSTVNGFLPETPPGAPLADLTEPGTARGSPVAITPARSGAESDAQDLAVGHATSPWDDVPGDWWKGLPTTSPSPPSFLSPAAVPPTAFVPAAEATAGVSAAPTEVGLGAPSVSVGGGDPHLLVPALGNAASIPATAGQAPASASTPSAAAVQSQYAQLPLSFEANEGQTDPQVKFLAHGPGYTLFLTATEAVMVLSPPAARAAGTSPAAPFLPTRLAETATPAPAAVVRIQLVGADPNAAVTGESELPGKVNYFLGNDPRQWHSDVPTYSQVHYHGVYPGVDLVYHGSQGQPEYDFLASPGADLSRIHLSFAGADNVAVDAQGNLVLDTTAGPIVQPKPVVYQDVDGVRRKVAGSYLLKGPQEAGFQVGAHDLGRPLVIDPMLVYSTYLGGSGGEDGIGIAVDTAGDAYVLGETSSADFPTVNPVQPSYGGGVSDAFVTKLNATGSALLYSTYLGGSDYDIPGGIAVDPAGNAYVTGTTQSRNFPTAHAFQSSLRGSANAFVAKLNAAGSALLYSTYLGGTRTDQGYAIAADVAGNAYVTGYTSSRDFPTANALQSFYRGVDNAFVTKFNATGSALVFSTYLGGSQVDVAHGIAVDPAGNTYVTGYSSSTNFPTANALQPRNHGGFDGFVSELNAAGSALIYSTYLGGSARDEGLGIAVDAVGSAYVAGDTSSADLPTTPDAFQTTFQGGGPNGTDGFVAKLNASGTTLAYSSYLGGSGDDGVYSIAVDRAGDAYVTGWTNSTDFPTADPLQPVFGGGLYDAFVTELNATGSAGIYSTFLGGSADDQGFGIAVDAVGNAFVTGRTFSFNFPTTPGAFQAQLRSTGNAFVTEIGASMISPYLVFNTNDSGRGSLRQAILDADGSSDPVTITFAIPGSGVQTITPLSPLPSLTTSVVLDGTSQPGYAGQPLIVLDGAGAGPSADGLTVAAGGSIIQGLVISDFGGAGLHLEGAGGDLVTGDYLGTDATGALTRGNGIGVFIDNTTANTVGGTTTAARNLISGNRQDGVRIGLGATGNLIEGNFIGSDLTGAGAVPNGASGITVSSARNTIGGTAAGAGNLISGNTGDGISLGGIDNQVLGNTIGTNLARTAALGNRDGIAIGGPNNTVGGVEAAARNVIAGNRSDGVALNPGATANLLQGNVIAANTGNGVVIAAGAASNVLWGNAIGTTPAGRRAYPNGLNGVVVAGSDNLIGGTAGGTGNVISGNTFDGIDLTGRGAVFNLVQGNLIGTDATGTRVLGNGTEGINLDGGAADNTIGGTTPGAGNVFAGNSGDGVGLADPGTTANLIQGNFIGTDPSGRLALGNGANGVYFEHNASGNTVGGTATGAGNTIAFNTDDGVAVVSGTGNAIQENRISSSGNLGIELINGGNHDQAFPTLTAVTSDGSSTTIAGTLRSAPDTTFTLEFFANDVCNPSGYGEGQTFLGSAAVTTDDTGTVTFTVTVSAGVAAGQFVSATATDLGGNTSQFAACVQVPSTT